MADAPQNLTPAAYTAATGNAPTPTLSAEQLAAQNAAAGISQSNPAPITTPAPAPSADPSVVDYLSSIGQATDFNSRAQLAIAHGIANYTGTADQNTQLLNALRVSKAAQSGGASATQGADLGAAAGAGNFNATGLPNNTGSVLGAGSLPTPKTPTPLSSLPTTGNAQVDGIIANGVKNGTLDSSLAGILSLIGSSSPGQDSVDSTTKALLAAMTSENGQGADLTQALSDNGVPQSTSALKSLNLELAQLSGSISAFDAETQNGLSTIDNQAIPSGLVQGQQAAYQKQRDLTKLSMTAELTAKTALAQAYQGNIDLGTKLAQQAVDIKYQPIENNIKVLQTQLAAAKDTLSGEDSKKSSIVSALLTQVSANVAQKKADESKVQSLAVTAASNNAPASVVSSMQAATDPVQAAKIGANYLGPASSNTGGGGGGTNFTTTQTNNGAQNAGLAVADFKALPSEVQNFYVSAPQASIDAVNSVLSSVKSGATSVADANKWVDGNNISGAFKSYLKTQISSSAPTSGGGGWLGATGSALGNVGGWLGGVWNAITSPAS